MKREVASSRDTIICTGHLHELWSFVVELMTADVSEYRSGRKSLILGGV